MNNVRLVIPTDLNLNQALAWFLTLGVSLFKHRKGDNNNNKKNILNGMNFSDIHVQLLCHGPLVRYIKLWVAHAPGMPGKFSLPPRVSDPDTRAVMDAGECATRTFASLVRGPKARILVTADGSNFCGCDGADLIIPDSGEGDNWPLFPVRELVMGDTGDANEYIDYKLGPLVCKQGMAIHATIVYRNK